MAGTKPSGGRRLVIVESPAKAKTIAGYLGDGYVVESSIGHIRDLPHSAAEVPAEQKKESWARLGVNVDSDFEPLYVVDPKKTKVVTSLRAKLKDADELLLATDEDREGEAIAWHLVQVLKPKVPVRRMVFHEITKGAIERALERDARDRRPARRRAGDAAHPRPALRLRGLAGALAQGDERALGRARAVGRDAARRRARARADGVRRRRVLGHRRHVLRLGRVHRAARRRSTAAASRRAATSRATGR